MVNVTVDGKQVEVPNGATVIQACELAGVEIPRFCYHERLAIAGNCRMCLVEVEKAPKPVASCAMPVNEGMVVHTDTPKVKKAREGVMEFLLINHPLDCPICDQGGECDLQDQAMAYGSGTSRFAENKRAVEEKTMGPLIKTAMTRCIHCTRCIRFAQDIAGVPELGAVGRGEHMEITTYLDKALASELSANVIDLCPVGALTSKPYAFKSRPWELTHTESVDVMDAVGSNIRIDTRGREVMRVLPRLNEDINEEWISDKTRYAIDGLKTQRLDKPMIRRNGRLEPCSWEEALSAVSEKMRSIPGDKMAAIAGDLCDAESMAALLGLMQSLGSPHTDCRQDGAALDASAPASYRFNTTIAGIEEADACLIIGSNPRTEAPIINARLRKRYLRGGLTVASIGVPIDLTFPVMDLGNAPALLTEIAAGTHPFAKTLQNAKRPMLIIGMDALKGEDGAKVLGVARAIAESCGLMQEGWNGFNVLHTAAARVGGLAMEFVPGKKGMNVNAMLKAAQKGTLELVYLLGADEIDTEALGDAFVVYQGHHGDRGAHRADVIFPGAAYTEKDGLYVNTEGRVQEGFRAVFPPGEAREDWKIIRALSESVGKTLPFDDLASLRQQLAAEVPLFATRDVVLPATWGNFGAMDAISRKKFDVATHNFYMTNALCRASRTMAECTRTFITPEQKAA